MDPGEPLSILLANIILPWNTGIVIGLVVMLLLLFCSALISGSEVAFFSISPQDKEKLEEDEGRNSARVLELLQRPKTLLATILIGNNLVNVAIVILSSFLMSMMFDFGESVAVAFLVQVVVVTLIILIVGEIAPKVYASKQGLTLSRFMSAPIVVMMRLFSPLAKLLVQGTRKIDERARENEGDNQITADELSHALELTTDDETQEDEKRILSGIVKFGSTEARQVMTPRVDVTSIDVDTNFASLGNHILDKGYSRIPIFKESFDEVVGVLFVKDLLPHLGAEADFKWQDLIRQPHFVTENKKLDDLLREFQEKRNHLAVVVDEYGGSSGIITLEDIIEEIVGEITDEFDDDELIYSKLDDKNYVFDGKTALIDMYRVLDIEGEDFEKAKGDSDSIAGFILELTGKIPLKNERVKFDNYLFTIEAADKRRVKRIKVTILD